VQERQIDMTETSEEAVVGKEARVREELVVRKTAEERSEQVQDTVRHTEVDVDDGVRDTAGPLRLRRLRRHRQQRGEQERSRSESVETATRAATESTAFGSVCVPERAVPRGRPFHVRATRLDPRLSC
jgi:hypothetical protein